MYLQHQAIEEFIQEIIDYNTIIIHRHQRPDPDAIGSQLGLKTIIQENFPNKKVLAAGTITKGLSWIGDMDHVSKEDYDNALVIICDTANHERIDGKHYYLGSKIIKIDHHPNIDQYADIEIVHPEAAACCEMLTMLCQASQGRFQISDESARLLYIGLVSDTGRFLFNSTSSHTLAMGAYLMQFNFDAFQINDQFQTITRAQAKFEAFIMGELTIINDQIAYVTISKEDMDQYGISEEETHAVVQLPGKIIGIKSWIIFVEQDGVPKRWRARIRSKGPEIHHFASNHHGGGHPMASGAYAFSLEEKQEMIDELVRIVMETENNEEN